MIFAWLLLRSIHWNQQRNQRSLSGIWSLREKLVLTREGYNFEKPRSMKRVLNINVNTQERVLTGPSQLENEIFLDLASRAQSFILFHIPASRIKSPYRPWQLIKRVVWICFCCCCKTCPPNISTDGKGTCRALASWGCVLPPHSLVPSRPAARPAHDCETSAWY